VQALAPEVSREEDAAPACQHVQRIQAVGGLVAEETRREAVELPQPKHGRHRHDDGDVQPRAGIPGAAMGVSHGAEFTMKPAGRLRQNTHCIAMRSLGVEASAG